MPIIPDALLDPAGPVTPSLFPGEGVNELRVRLQQYIDNATAEEAVVAAPADRQDGMVRAHSLMQVFTAVYIRLSTEPLTVTVTEKGGHGYSAEQIRNMRDLAAKYRADYEGLIVPVGTIRPGLLPSTMNVPTSVEW